MGDKAAFFCQSGSELHGAEHGLGAFRLREAAGQTSTAWANNRYGARSPENSKQGHLLLALTNQPY